MSKCNRRSAGKKETEPVARNYSTSKLKNASKHKGKRPWRSPFIVKWHHATFLFVNSYSEEHFWTVTSAGIAIPMKQEVKGTGHMVNFIKNETSTWAFPFQKLLPPEVFSKKGVLRNFAKFTGRQRCWNLYLIMLQTSRSLTLSKRDSTCEFCKIS